MTPKKALLVVLAKMAWENGEIHPAEIQFIEELCERWGLTMDIVRRAMAAFRVNALVSHLAAPRDRVVAVYYVWIMANIEGTFDAWEQDLYDLVIDILGITSEELQLAEHAGRLVLDGKAAPDAWMQRLAGSSLA